MPEKLPGYYFGNNSFFTFFGKIFDKFLKTIYGEVDYTREPYSRNKVDYASRIIFPCVFCFYTVIYILVSIKKSIVYI